MDPNLTKLLLDLGIGVGANAIYDFLKRRTASGEDCGKVAEDLAAFLHVDGANVKAEKIITFLANKGDIVITNSKIYAKDSIEYRSQNDTSFSIQGSTSETDRTKIEVGDQAKIIGQGGAQIVHNRDGSISFKV